MAPIISCKVVPFESIWDPCAYAYEGKKNRLSQKVRIVVVHSHLQWVYIHPYIQKFVNLFRTSERMITE